MDADRRTDNALVKHQADIKQLLNKGEFQKKIYLKGLKQIEQELGLNSAA